MLPLNREAAISRLDLTRWLLRVAGLHTEADALSDDVAVFLMDDGGMGSFNLAPSSAAGQPVAEATFDDDDGVEVSVTLYADATRRPTHVDFWRVDFEPLLTFPSQNQLRDSRALP